jgi:hypothetical protein
MPKVDEKRVELEPIGIIIARAATAPRVPRFSAYVWAGADEPDAVPEETKAA